AALLTDGNSTENQPPAEVISFLVDFHPTEPDADLGMYQGPGCITKAACIADILDVASNWVLEEENGADCCDGNGVDYPGDFLGALPVEWAGFDVRLSNTEARLSWSTHSETANAGFVIEHRYQSSSFVDVGFVTGAGTTDQPQTYAFQVADLVPGLHAFRLRQIDLDGTVRYSETVEVEVPTSSRLTLAPVYPNPFETEATLTFAVAEDADVRLALYDVLGREVHVVFEGRVPAGESRSIRIRGHELRPGTYFARLTDSRGGVAVRSVISG
ncbi:MAG: T9SS type A sorting domain-containing protein, partial [Bacteroidota bacterium]